MGMTRRDRRVLSSRRNAEAVALGNRYTVGVDNFNTLRFVFEREIVVSENARVSMDNQPCTNIAQDSPYSFLCANASVTSSGTYDNCIFETGISSVDGGSLTPFVWFVDAL